jgi:vacuolar-type H+-ATPase subunit I/STV1
VITRMKKIELVVRQQDRDGALAVLGELGVLHVVPVDPSRAVARAPSPRSWNG